MKVLLVSSEPASDRGFGSGRFVEGLAKSLAKREVETALLTGSGTKEAGSLPKIRSKVLRKFLFDYVHPLAYQQFSRTVKETRPDVIHFNNIYGISSGLVAYASRSYPTIVTVHDYWPFCYFSTMMKKDKICDMECRTCAPPLTTISRTIRRSQLNGSVLVSPSLYMKDRLQRAGFSRVKHIPNGVDRPLDKSPDNPRLLFIGRLVKSKGVDKLARVGTSLRCPIHIIGSGPLASQMSTICRTNHHMTFHGFVPDVSMILREGGILVIPSVWPENQPTVALEGLAYGLPIVSSDIGGLAEVVEHGVNGYLFDPWDQEALASHLEDLVSSKRTRAEFGSSSRRKSKAFTWERTSREYELLYERITTM